MTRKRTTARLVDDGAGLQVFRPVDRMVEDAAHLTVTPPPAPSRFADTGEGLLVTPAGALTAAPGDDGDRDPDPWQEQRLQAAADLARWERKLEHSAGRALSAWTAVVRAAVLDDRYVDPDADGTLTAAAYGQRLIGHAARQLGDTPPRYTDPGATPEERAALGYLTAAGELPPDPGAVPPLRNTWLQIARAHILRSIGDLLGEVFARLLRDDARVVSARPWQDAYLDTVANRLVNVADSTFDLVRGVVQDGIDEGMAIPDIRDRVQESLDTGGEVSWANRARTIARTETIGAYNGGHLAAWEVWEDETGDPVHKSWLATIDGRTRDSHFAADGQRRLLGEPFRVGNSDLAFPGDPTAPPEECINCRCTMLELDPDEPTPDTSERGFRDPADVQAEIDRRAEQDPPVVRAYDAPADAVTAAAAPPGPRRPDEALVARMDGIFQASYTDTADELLLAAGDEAVVDPDWLAKHVPALVAAGLGGLAKGNFFDPNQKRDDHGRWTVHGSGISITVKDSKGRDAGAVDASFTDPTEALARVTWEHDDLTDTAGNVYRSEITRIDGPAEGDYDRAIPDGGNYDLKVRGSLLDSRGHFAGEFVRYVRNTDAGPEVYHGELRLNEDHQGRGLGSEFNRRAEEVYRAAGVTHVTLNATSNATHGYVGGYVWARRGYGWNGSPGPHNVANALRSISPKGADPAVDALHDRLKAATESNLADLPTPREISELTSKPLRMSLPPDGNIGRAALLRSTWYGVRWLPAPEPDGAATAKADKALKKAGGSGKTSPSPLLRGADADAALQDLIDGPDSVDLTDEEFEALLSYRTNGFGAMNAHLRGLSGIYDAFGSRIPPVTPTQLEEIADLRAIAARHRLPAPVEAWRGMQGVARILPPRGAAAGTVVTDPGFMSVTTDRKIAERFTGGVDADMLDAALLRITVPAGHPGIPMEALTGGIDDAPEELADERELVLPPGASLRITGELPDQGGVRVLTAEVLPYGGDEGLAAQEAAVTVRAPRAPSTADPAKLTAAQKKALGWIADPTGPAPRTDVLRRLVDAGLITEPPRGWDWDKSTLTDDGRSALGLDPEPTSLAPEPARDDEADALLASMVTAPLSERDQQAVNGYTFHTYQPINQHLRTGFGLGDRMREDIDRLRTVAAAHPVPAPVEVWRGIRSADRILPSDGSAVGSVVTDPGFMSTTTNSMVAEDFLDLDGSALLRLTVPAGHPALPVDQLLVGPGGDPEHHGHGGSREHELTLPPGSSFRITADERDDQGRRVLTAEVLPYPAADTTPTGSADTAPPTPAPAPAPELGPAAGWSLSAKMLKGKQALAAASSTVTADPSPQEVAALRGYVGASYERINPYLRGLEGVPVRDNDLADVALLQGLADRHRLPEPVQVYRGLYGAEDVFGADDARGSVIVDPGFLSTTTERAVAEDFADAEDDGALIRFDVPAGFPVIPVDQLKAGAGNPAGDNESELIFPPGTSFRVKSDTRDGGRRVLTVEALPYLTPVDSDGDGQPDAPASAEAVAEAAVADVVPDAPDPAAREFRAVGDGDPAAGDAWLREHFDPKTLSKPEKEALGYWTSNNYRQVNTLLRTGSLELKVMTDQGRFEFDPAVGYDRRVTPAVYETRTVHSPDDIRALAALGYNGRDFVLDRLANQLDNLPAALDRHQLPEDLSLYRVAALPELAAADPASLIGSTITDRGFVATSTSPKSAVLVTSEALGVRGPDAVLFEIRTPAGTPYGTPEVPLGTVNGQKLGGYTAVQEVLLNPSAFRVVDVLDDEVDTSGYSIKNGSKVKVDKKAKRSPTAIRRIVVERVGDAPPLERGEPVLDPSAPLPAPETLTPERVDAAAAVLGPDRVAELTDGRGTDDADLPAVQAVVAEADAVAAAPVVPPTVKLTAPRRVALDYYAVPPGDRSGKAPNYSVYMPLVKAGLVEKNADGRLVLTAAGRDRRDAEAASTPATSTDAAPTAPVPDVLADEPVEPATASAATAVSPAEAAAARLEGRDAFAAFRSITDLDPASLTAARTYQEGGVYEDLNDGLRTMGRAGNGDPTVADIEAFLQTGPNAMEDWYAAAKAPQHDEVRRALDAAIADSPPLDRPATLYRGVTNLAEVFGTDDPDGLVGSTLVDHAFMSTTANRDIARLFGTPATEQHIFARGSGGALIRINTPAGTRALRLGGAGNGLNGPDADGFEVGDGEAEVLMPRGTSLRVSAVSTEKLWDGQDWTVLDVDLVPPGGTLDARDASPGDDAAPTAPDADAPTPDDDALDAERAAAEKKATAAAKRAAKKAAKALADQEAARAADLSQQTDGNGYPLAFTNDYLQGLDDDAREDLEVALIEGVAAGDPLAEARLEDLTLWHDVNDRVDQLVEDLAGSDDDTITQQVDAFLAANGKPGLTHPAVGGAGAGASTRDAKPSMKQVRQEYAEFLHQQYVAAEDATRGSMLNKAGLRRVAKGTLTQFDMFSSPRGVADVMQYASDELLEWFETNRRISWAEFYYDRTGAAGYAAKAAKARDLSGRIDRDRNALEHIHVPRKKYRAALERCLTAAAAPAAPREPDRDQLDAYAAGRAAHADGRPITDCPHPPGGDDPDGLFVLWIRGYVNGKRAAALAARAAEGLVRHPAAGRLSYAGGELLVLPPTSHDADPGGRLLVDSADLELSAAAVLTASPAPAGQTVTAAGSGPGDPSEPGDVRPMPRTWRSAPHLAPFGTPTGDHRIFKVGSLTARALPLPLLFQPSSGFGHDGSVVVGRILAVNFTDGGIEASGDYLDVDAEKAPDLSKAVEQAVALTESGLGHVSVDLSDVVGELVDEDGNPIDMEELYDAWERGEEPVVLEQVSEGKLIACTQVATPAFEGAKIELAATEAADVDGEAAFTDPDGVGITVGSTVDAETDDGTVRGRVTAVDEEADSVTVQPTDADGVDSGDPVTVTSAAITVITAADDDTDSDVEQQVEALLAAAGPLRPPAEWFADPKLTAPTALTITDDGRVYGHAATWGSCHVGFSNTCVAPPSSPSGYKHFHVGEVVCEDGSRIAVGNLTLGGRHADVRLAYRSAIEHYDVSGAGVAVIRCYEDEHGIAFAGAVAPGTTEEQLYDMRRSPVSGDWRRVGGDLEMIGVLSVNSGGFNTPRFATDEAGRTALVAAPSVRPMSEDAIVAAAGGRGRGRGLSQDELVRRVTAQVRAELAADTARAERSRRLAGLAASIKADPRSRMAALVDRVEAPSREARASRVAELAQLVGVR